MKQEEILDLLNIWVDGSSTKRDLLFAASQLSQIPKKNLPNFGYRVFQIDLDNDLKTWQQFTNKLHQRYPESYSASIEAAKTFARGSLDPNSILVILGVQLKPNDIKFYVPEIVGNISEIVRHECKSKYDSICYFMEEDEVVTRPGILKNRLLSGDAYLVGYQEVNEIGLSKFSIYYLDRPQRIILNTELPWIP